MGLGPAGATVDSIFRLQHTPEFVASSFLNHPFIGCLDSRPIPQVSRNGKSCAAHGLSTYLRTTIQNFPSLL